ncbi:hypothetical protein V8J88_20015 [Massilia sp. W12]|uniref:hypothetical protein n=1 Tax=Massilia sp. W12 TaxID=3126507 RepID=UPI0030D48489
MPYRFRNPKRLMQFTCSAVALAALGACGGGDGSWGSGKGEAPASGQLSITVANQLQVAGQVLRAANGLALNDGLEPGTVRRTHPNDLLQKVFEAINTEVPKREGTSYSFSVACGSDAAAGAVNVAVTLKTAKVLAAGDNAQVTVQTCQLNQVWFGGAAKIEYTANVNGEFNAVFSNFALQEGTEKFILNGDSLIAKAGDAYLNTGKRLVLARYSNNVLIDEKELTEYTLRSGNKSFGLGGKFLYKGAKPGNFQAEINNASIFIASDKYPVLGRLTVLGSSYSMLALAPLGTNAMRIDFTDQKDGKITNSQNSTYEDVQKALN